MKLSGAQILTQALKAEGVRHIFGMSGSDVLYLLDVIYQERQIRYIQSQHEQGAMYMANGYARATRTPGICLVSPGPGITNCLSGMGQAFFSSTPSVLISTEEDTRYYGRGSSMHHDLEALPMLKPVTKLALRVERVDRIAESVQAAFRTALAGRKGPVYLGIAKDLLEEETEAEIVPPEQYRVTTPHLVDPEVIGRAADLLLAAERPVALAGGGVAWAGAREAFLELSECLAMPMATSRDNKGLVPDDHPLALGTVGWTCAPVSLKTMQAADVILAVGCTFDEFTTAAFGHEIIPRGVKIIQIDIDPLEIGKIYPVALGIAGDARKALSAILGEIKARSIDRRPIEQAPRIRELIEKKRKWQDFLHGQQTSDKVPIQRLRLFHDLRQALPRNAIVAAASGSTNKWFDYGFEALVHNFGVGSWHPMGGELPECLGIKVALPDRVVVCVTGDGSLMMSLPEIATAVASHIPILCVVCHNGVFGNMRYTQIKRFDGRFIGTELLIPDLAETARLFGAYGERVEKPEEIVPAVRRALGSGKPALLDVMLDNAVDELAPQRPPVDL